jgi:hypothetical protein
MSDDNAADDNLRDIDDGNLEEGQSIIAPLDEDNDTPFSEPDDPVTDPTLDVDIKKQQGRLNPTHQATDNATDIDSHQLYDEGLAGAAEASEPNSGNAVVGYDPEKDQRKQSSDD